jgi:hypothetical protein
VCTLRVPGQRAAGGKAPHPSLLLPPPPVLELPALLALLT